MKFIRSIFLLINFVAIGCMLMTYLGSSLSPEKFIIPAYFALAYPLILLINVLFIFLWLFRKRWYFVFSLLVIILSFSKVKTVIPLNSQKKQEVSERSTFSIMSYNSYALGKYQKHTEDKPNKVVQQILESDADVVCLQEFTVSEDKKYLTENDVINLLKKYPYRHIYYHKEKGSLKSGIATFSKFRIIKKETVDYVSKYNCSIFSDMIINNDTVRLLNCHLESNKLTGKEKAMPLELRNNFDAENISSVTAHLSKKLGAAYKIRAKQADAIAELVQKSPYKVFVCGDFNDVPLSYTYSKIKGELNDSFAEVGSGIGSTYNENIYLFRIDYILADKYFIPLKFDIDKVKYSDHYPVVCNFTTK